MTTSLFADTAGEPVTRIILILGPPGSGLTLVSRCLQVMGVRTMSSAARTRAAALNRLLLQDLGQSTLFASPLPGGWMRSPAALEARKRLDRLLADLPFSPCTLADPALCRVLPLWRQAFRKKNIEHKCLYVHRHPEKSLRSVEARDLLRHCPDHVPISFDRLLADPITSLQTALPDLPMPRSTAQALLRLVKPPPTVDSPPPPASTPPPHPKPFQPFLHLGVSLPSGYDRETRFPLLPDQWQEISLDIPAPTGPLRLIPSGGTTTLALSAVALVHRATRKPLWTGSRPEDLKTAALHGPALRTPHRDRLTALLFGHPCEIHVPLPQDLPDVPLRLCLWVRAASDPRPLLRTLDTLLSAPLWEAILGPEADAPACRKMAAALSSTGNHGPADRVLGQGLDRSGFAINYLTDYAEASMQRHHWAEAVRRWQLIVDKHGPSTPPSVYARLSQAYTRLDAFPRGTAEQEARRGKMDYIDFLFRLHQDLRPQSYLEIGVQNGRSLFLARCRALGVDPMPRVRATPPHIRIHPVTSDAFFENPPETLLTNPPDLAFIDGMHLFEYALKDFMNVEARSSPRTLVAMDDIFPNHPRQADRVRSTQVWTGDVWKLYEILTRYRPDLVLLSVDTSPTGLLLIAGLDRSNQVLQERYQAILSEFKTDLPPPAWILERKKALPPDHEDIRRLLTEQAEKRVDNCTIKL